MSVIPQLAKNDHEYTYGTTRNESDSTTVVLPFRPCPQSTPICHKCFKQFKTFVVLLCRPQNYHDSSLIIMVYAKVSMVLLQITPVRHDLINRGES